VLSFRVDEDIPRLDVEVKRALRMGARQRLAQAASHVKNGFRP
jgi:hypothetical protein